MSKIPLLMFLLTAIILGILLFCLCRTEPPVAHGVPHDEYSEMYQGGGPDRHANLIVLGGLYGGLQIVLMVACLCLAIRNDRSNSIPLVVGGAAYLGVFVAMVITYADGMDRAPLVLGIPLPTALMVFGMWGVPVVFIILYLVNFHEWIYNEEDKQRFAELMKSNRDQEATRG